MGGYPVQVLAMLKAAFGSAQEVSPKYKATPGNGGELASPAKPPAVPPADGISCPCGLTSVSAIIRYSRIQTCSADPSEGKLDASGKKTLLSWGEAS